MTGKRNTIQAEVVKDQARGQWAGILTALGIPAESLTEKHKSCPGCAGKDRFRFDDKDGNGTFICSGGGETTAGDGFALLQHVHGWDFPAALNKVAEHLGMDSAAEITPEERKAQKERAEQAQLEAIEREKAKQEGKAAQHQEAAQLAQTKLDNATAANPQQPYLVKKNLPPLNLKQSGDDLLLSVQGINEQGQLTIQTYERITPDGTKLLQKGGKKVGGFHLVAKGADDEPLLIAEGWATGAALHLSTGYTVLMAIDAGNIIHVAKLARDKYPARKIILCADNDKAGKDNAHAAAAAIGGHVATAEGETKADFWDMWSELGPEAVRAAVLDYDEPTAGPDYFLERIEGVPHGYKVTLDGVYQLKETEEGQSKRVRITLAPVFVEAINTDDGDDNWGRLVTWLTIRGTEHSRAVPQQLFHQQGYTLAGELSRGGVAIVPGQEKALMVYLGLFLPDKWMLAATSNGWSEGNAFVLPYETINQPDNLSIVYQPSYQSNVAHSISKAGDFESWKHGIAGASLPVIFFVCAALSAPVRFKAGIEAGGFHGYNLTSQGKTTKLQAAATVWGNGTDPAIAGGSEAYIQRWNTTANALEARAEIFNDLPLIIDEIGEGDPKEFGRTIYRVISGTGRGRSGRDGNLRDSKSWRVLILSAGEVAVSDFIESGGGRVKGGQLVRLIDIDLSALPPLFPDKQAADAMKRLCAEHYGHAGPELLRIPSLAEAWDSFDQEQIGPADSNIEGRARTRIALVAYTGMLAAHHGIVPWTMQQVLESCQQVYEAWRGQLDTVDDTERGIIAVRDFILAHDSRFERPEQQYPTRDRAGWLRDGFYHFSKEGFKEACNGADAEKVRKALKDAGLLHINKPKGLLSNVRVGERIISATSVKAEILDSVTTVTTVTTEVVTAETRATQGPLPPLPPLPPKNANPDSDQETGQIYEEII